MALEIKKQQIFKRDPQLQSAWITFSVYLFVLLLGNCICTRTHVSEFAVFVGSVFVQQKSNVAHSRTYVYVTALGEHAYAVCMQAWSHRSMDSSCTCVRKQEAGPRRYMRLYSAFLFYSSWFRRLSLSSFLVASWTNFSFPKTDCSAQAHSATTQEECE